MLYTPDGGTTLELSTFVRPDHLPGSLAAPANELGLRNVAFEVDDVQAAVDQVARTATGWSVASASTKALGGWPMSGGRRGSSSRWPIGSAEPRNPDRGAGEVDPRSIHTEQATRPLPCDQPRRRRERRICHLGFGENER